MAELAVWFWFGLWFCKANNGIGYREVHRDITSLSQANDGREPTTG